MLLYRNINGMEKSTHTSSNCIEVRFVAYYFQILQKPLFTDTADTIFVLYFEQLRNALGISTAEKKIFVPDICAIHYFVGLVLLHLLVLIRSLHDFYVQLPCLIADYAQTSCYRYSKSPFYIFCKPLFFAYSATPR